jgi:hypothetical protein
VTQCDSGVKRFSRKIFEQHAHVRLASFRPLARARRLPYHSPSFVELGHRFELGHWFELETGVASRILEQQNGTLSAE